MMLTYLDLRELNNIAGGDDDMTIGEIVNRFAEIGEKDLALPPETFFRALPPYHCPRCEETVYKNIGTYCPHCGQHIDWSDI